MNKTDGHGFLDKNKLEQSYSEYKPHFDILLLRLTEHVQSIFKDAGYPLYSKNRVKSFASYYKKVQKYNVVGVNGEIPLVTDILAIRLMTSFMSDLKPVENILLDNFECCDLENKGGNLSYREFGYKSIHLLLKIPQEFKVGLLLPEGLVLEIQVRTVLQDAWAEIEHDLVYKAELTSFDEPMRRKLAAINASLTLADIVFQEINDYQKKLNTALDRRRFDFYEKADEFTEKFLTGEFPELKNMYEPNKKNIFEKTENIDDMLLAALEAHNVGDFRLAVGIYTTVIEMLGIRDETNKNNALSIIYKHRGMAYFSQSNYEAAQNDFLLSEKHDAKNFRAYYYRGIALVMMGRNSDAINEFTKSLQIKDGQAHVYFRRGLAYYANGFYVEALHDIDSAKSFGLENEDTKKLRMAIAKKIDIV